MLHRSTCTVSLVVVLVLTALAAVPTRAAWKLPQMVSENRDGEKVFHAKPMDDRFRNPWPEEYERQFQARARRVIAAQSQRRARGSTYFENEKRYYGYLMAQVLGEQGLEAMKRLQGEDHQAESWHRHTAGIDYYACFTLKHQMRKYFYFGDLMDPDYRRRMYQGAKKWTEKDPLHRPHYAFKKASGWGPDAKNSWVDVRTTENLFLMRVTSVYLMAEETGNRRTAATYKQIILDYAKSLYRVGMGEWDSENYHGHSLSPLLNLYDFAKDDEVKLAAKACLDWLCAAGAVKYYRGGFNGPGSRDYNHAQPFGGSAASMLWLYFGDCPQPEHDWESDEVHVITSAYRPPVAVMKLARKEFSRPVEIFASKPHYSATTSFDTESPPEFLETQYIADTYLFGSLSCGTPPGVSAVNGFKILVYDREDGCRILHAAPTDDPNFAGSPLYRKGKINAENRVAQYGNLAIWLARGGKSPWLWVVPEGANMQRKNGITFIECERTWIAIHPLGTSSFQRDEKLTRQAGEGKDARFKNHTVLSAKGNGKRYCGIAVEIGEKQSHGSFGRFRQQVLGAEVDASQLGEGIVKYRAADGKHLGFHWNDDPQDLGAWRNGERHDWAEHAAYLYRTGDADEPTGPIHSRWGEGALYVEAGGAAFACAVDEQGGVRFEHGDPDEVNVREVSRVDGE